MSGRISVGIVGFGFWGARMTDCFSRLSQADVVWVCDRSKKARLRAARAYPKARITADLEACLDDESLEAVVVATPASTHYDFARRALEAGKHVLVHGALALGAREADELVELAAFKNLRLVIGHVLFFHPAVRKLKELVELGQLGDLYYLYGQRQEPAKSRNRDLLWAFAADQVSIILLLLGEEPAEVSVRAEAYVQPGAPDVLYCHMQFPSGVGAHVQLSRLDLVERCSLAVVGSKATAVFDDREHERKLTVYPHSGDVISPRVVRDDPLRLECDYFVASTRSSAETVAGAHEGAMVAKVIEMLRVSFAEDGMHTPARRPAGRSTVIPLRKAGR